MIDGFRENIQRKHTINDLFFWWFGVFYRQRRIRHRDAIIIAEHLRIERRGGEQLGEAARAAAVEVYAVGGHSLSTMMSGLTIPIDSGRKIDSMIMSLT